MRHFATLLLFLLSFTCHSFEDEKYQLISEIVHIQGTDKDLERYIHNYKSELERFYPDLDKTELNQFIGDYSAVLMALQLDSYNQLSEEELTELLMFYKSDEGQRHLQFKKKIDSFYLQYHELIQKDFNNRLNKMLSQ